MNPHHVVHHHHHHGEDGVKNDEVIKMDFDVEPVSAREWVPLSRMNYARTAVKTVVLDGRLLWLE